MAPIRDILRLIRQNPCLAGLSQEVQNFAVLTNVSVQLYQGAQINATESPKEWLPTQLQPEVRKHRAILFRHHPSDRKQCHVGCSGLLCARREKEISP